MNKRLQVRYIRSYMTLHPGGTVLNLLESLLCPDHPLEKQHFQKLMQKYHYQGALPKIRETLC